MLAKRREDNNDCPKANLSHHSSGRTRIYIPSRRKDAHFFQQLRKELKKAPGVTDVKNNVVTGSSLILHETPFSGIEDYARDHQLFTVTPKRRESSAPVDFGQRMVQQIDRIDRYIMGRSQGQYDLRATTFISLVGLGALQIFRGEWLPPASTLLRDALTALSSDPIAGGFAQRRKDGLG